MRLTVPELVVLAAVLVVVMTAATILLLRGENWEKRTAARLALAATPHAPAMVVAVMGRKQGEAPSASARLGRSVTGLLGYDPVRADQLPYPAALVLAAAFLAGVGGCMLLSLLAGPQVLLAAPVAGVFASRALFGVFAARRAAKLYVQLPDALSMIVRTIRVGTPVSEALRVVSREAPVPTATEFGRLSDQVAIGTALEDALRELAARSGLPEYRFFATTLSLQAQTGGALSETLDNLADVVRKRVAMRSRAHALASEARTSTYILAALPVATGVLLGVVNPAYIGVLFTDPTGNKLFAAAVAMLSVGMGVMRLIISRALR